MTRIIPVLGDQLTPTLSSLKAAERADDVVLMCEAWDETQYVRHHKKKIAFVFSAMRHFAKELKADGWRVDYRAFDPKAKQKAITNFLAQTIQEHKATSVLMTEPGEWRIRNQLTKWAIAESVTLEMLPDDRFFCSTADFNEWAMGRKQLRMENFYRMMRHREGILMEGDDPIGARWNFDADNRKKLPSDLSPPAPFTAKPTKITQEVLDLVDQHFADHFGDLNPFALATTRKGAEAALDHFLEHLLPRFGDYQDAMTDQRAYLFHSNISTYLNVGLLDARAVCLQVEEKYQSGDAPLNAVEGFVRQILGWREYVRGIYWREMPAYANQNFFEATHPLPEFYWTGETDMHCMKTVVDQTRVNGYSHHIQRLMITGTFGLLAGINPHALHEWYLAVYTDAYEWVELPNTLGMSQFADGGLLASKPYAASGAYINRMSNFCKSCRYNVTNRTGPDACPFNALYWDFLARHRSKLKTNTRLAMSYRTWDRKSEGEQNDLRASAAAFLQTLT